MLPAFDEKGRLPPGVHWAEWPEVSERFGWNEHRRRQLRGLLRALQNLRAAGCQVAYLDGSFVTLKEAPDDFDGCWDTTGVDIMKVDQVLKTFANGRILQKMKYFGELMPSHRVADDAGATFLNFFQIDKATGEAKGIVALSLRKLPS